MPAKSSQPFVIDVRDSDTADSRYYVRETWDEALELAGKRWTERDLAYDATKAPAKRFTAGPGYAPEVSVTCRVGRYLSLSHADGEGAFIRITRATK